MKWVVVTVAYVVGVFITAGFLTAGSCPAPPEFHVIAVASKVRTMEPAPLGCSMKAGWVRVDRPEGVLKIRLQPDTRVYIQLGDLWLTGSYLHLSAGRRMQIDYLPLSDHGNVQRGVATEIYMMEN